MINLGHWALDNRKLVYFLLVMLTLGGYAAFEGMSKLEDPEIKVKQANVITLYPGASAHEVELEVTDPLEKALRSMPSVKKVTSASQADASVITVELSELLGNDEVEQAFDMLRRKVADTQSSLPKGSQPSVVLDGMGDVFGMFYAMTYEGYTPEEAKRYAELIRREVQSVSGVSQVAIYGLQQQTINIDLREDRLSGLGIVPAQVLSLLQGQNETIYSGYFEAAGQRLRVSVSDRYRTVEDIASLIIQTPTGTQVRLGDLADISEGYSSPRRSGMRYDGREALGISISARSGTDITAIAREVETLVQELQEGRLPAGVTMEKVFFQPDRVSSALTDFMINLLESVVIVVVVLIFFMGWRSGAILGAGLFLTVLGSILILNLFDGTLQRVSLASFVLAMGMLVDNAIVVLDGIQIGLERGEERRLALTRPGQQTAMPLLGATLISILSFLPIFLSPDTTGIYVRDLFIVLAVSLLLSWVLALVLNPIMADAMLHPGRGGAETSDPYGGRFYQWLERALGWILAHRTISLGVVAISVGISIWGYRLLPQGFFPDMDYNQVYIEYRLPEGYTTERVDRDLSEIEAYLEAHPEVEHITASIGATPSRYNLVRSVAMPALSYGELIVDFSSPQEAVRAIDEIQAHLSAQYPEAQVRVKRYNLMFKEYPIEVEFRGPDPAVLRELSAQAVAIMQGHEHTLMARSNWPARTPALSINYDQPKALRSGLSRQDIGLSLLSATYGLPIGTFHDGSDGKTITIRTLDSQGKPIEGLEQTSISSMIPSLNALGAEMLQGLAMGTKTRDDLIAELTQPLPLSSVTDGVSLQWEEPAILRTNGARAIKAQCSPITGVANETLRSALAPAIEAIDLPEGYSRHWEGEYGASSEATQYLFGYYPLAIVLIVAILIMLFGDYRKPLVVILSLPVLAIGIVWGMFISGKTFGFTAIVAVLGLIGMMIKNIIVLLDEVVLLTRSGMPDYEALLQASKSRVRPVMLASATTILGMLPLLGDALFGPAAVVIMAGLSVASIATILFSPLVYALLYRVSRP